MSKIHQKKTLLNRYKYKGMILLIILILITAFVLIYSSFSDRIGGGLFSGDDSGRIGDNSFPFTANVGLPEIGFSVRETTLEISLTDSEGEFFLSDLGFNNLKNADTTLVNYEGVVEIDETGTLHLEGYADNVFINDMDVNKKDRNVRISVKDLHFESLKIADLYQKSLSFVSLGNINQGDFLEIEDEEVQISVKPFEGELLVEGDNLKLSGKTGTLLINPASIG